MKNKSVFDILIDKLSTLTPNEKKIAQVLIDEYPSNGLLSIPQLSKVVNISRTTVLRFISKIGFSSYSEFQNTLRSEIQAKFKTLPERYEDFTDIHHEKSEYQAYIQNSTKTLNTLLNESNKAKIKKIAEELSNEKKNVFIISGTMTKYIGQLCKSYINFIRPNVRYIEERDYLAITSLEINKGDVIIAIDMPRYEIEIFQFTQIAKERGANIILITDDSLFSDVVNNANHILTNKVLAPSPLDTYLGCLVQIELVALELILLLKGKFESRMTNLEKAKQILK